MRSTASCCASARACAGGGEGASTSKALVSMAWVARSVNSGGFNATGGQCGVAIAIEERVGSSFTEEEIVEPLEFAGTFSGFATLSTSIGAFCWSTCPSFSQVG